MKLIFCVHHDDEKSSVPLKQLFTKFQAYQQINTVPACMIKTAKNGKKFNVCANTYIPTKLYKDLASQLTFKSEWNTHQQFMFNSFKNKEQKYVLKDINIVLLLVFLILTHFHYGYSHGIGYCSTCTPSYSKNLFPILIHQWHLDQHH